MLKSPARRGRSVRLFRSLAAPAALLGLFAAAPVLAAGTPQWVPGRLLVQPRPGLSDQELDKILKPHGGKSVGRIAGINVHIVQLPPTASETAVAALLAKNPHLKFAEPDRVAAPGATANDPYFASEWHLAKIGAPTAWDNSSGSGVVIAILDTGVNGNHPDLAGKTVAGWNVYGNNADTSDVHGHGTAVAGAAAAASNNGIGVASVAGGAWIMPVRIADANAYAYWSTVAQGLTWSADHGARVANISYVGVSGSATVQSAAQYLRGKGGLVVVCAGNDGLQQSIAPSDTMITVAATDGNDVKTSWSSYGNFVDLAAPGLNIWTTTLSGGYQQWWGTSLSSPIVAATAGLMLAANPAIGPVDTEKLLFASAKDLGTAGWDMYYGYGRVDAAAAVLAAKNAGGSDTVAPTVSLSAPANGATVKGLVAVDVAAGDNVGVSRVDLIVNGVKLASDIAAPYGFSWDSTAAPDGNATLTAYAYDAAGNYSSSGIAVKVANTADSIAPVAAIANPAANATVGGTVNIRANASDNVGVTSLLLYIDGQLKSSTAGGAISYNWNTRKIAAGTHIIRVDAKDAAGNLGSASIQVVK